MTNFDRIKQLKLEHGLSLKELATQINVGESHLLGLRRAKEGCSLRS